MTVFVVGLERGVIILEVGKEFIDEDKRTDDFLIVTISYERQLCYGKVPKTISASVFQICVKF